jgi:hypothetical protein
MYRIALHIIYINASKHICYISNPSGNAGHCDITTGIDGPLRSDQVKVSPNPFSSQTTIEVTSSGNSGNIQLKVFDVLGREIITTTFNNDGRVILERNHLSDGIYFYRVFEKDKVIAGGKLIAE